MTIIHRRRAARHPASALDGVSGAATEHGRGNDSEITEEAAALHVASVGLRKLVRRRHVDRSQLGRAGNARPDRKRRCGRRPDNRLLGVLLRRHRLRAADRDSVPKCRNGYGLARSSFS